MSERLRAIFSEIPASYERANHILTFGFDALWRRLLADEAVSAGGERYLDVCTGTGETALAVARRAGNETLVIGADFTPAMMHEGMCRHGRRRILFVAAAALELPFPDGSFDVVTVSFAARNLTVSRDDLLMALREFRRVLRPGGRFLNLETSQPPIHAVRALLHAYARHAVGRIGAFISGSSAGYEYLSNTIRSFYGAEELAAVMREAGYARVEYRRFAMGVVALHAATK